MQALSIMTNWGLDTNTNRLWVEMALGQVGGGTTLTSLLIALISCIEVCFSRLRTSGTLS